MPPEKKTYFVLLGSIILVINLIGHLIGSSEIQMPLELPIVQTFWTSLTLAALFFSLFPKFIKLKKPLLILALSSQLVSLALYLLTSKNFPLYFQPSSLPTTLMCSYFIIGQCLLKDRLEHWGSFFAPFALLTCLIFLYSTISGELFLLGVSKKRFGVGVSPYTLFCFFMLTFYFLGTKTKYAKLNHIQIPFRPRLILAVLSLYAGINLFITLCPSEHRLLVSALIQISFLATLYFIVIRPFHVYRAKVMTLCAWSKDVKISEEQWIQPDKLLAAIGFNVSHGISPEEQEKMRQKRQRKNQASTAK